jgi:Tfp pilus assembly protein PilF
MRLLPGIALVACLLLQGCATAPAGSPVADAAFFRDELFQPASQRIDAADVFAMTPEMRRFLKRDIGRQLEDRGWHRGLVDALYRDGQLKLEYDAEVTRTAAQAFEARSGNCLSLVIMTAAFARELGLQVHYKRIFTDDAWSRVGELQVASTHVNVTLVSTKHDVRIIARERDWDQLTIDFMPSARGRAWRGYQIPEATVVAMFMNNRAAESIAHDRLDDAYWWARAAIVHDPNFLAAYNTLAVVYNRKGRLADAERLLVHVLSREADNTFALSNRVVVLWGMGRFAESQAVAARLASLEPHPPFYFYDRGRDAMKSGDYKAARDLFTREIQRDAEYHEFHFWLAAAHVALGELEPARRELAIAMRNSTTRADRDLYAAKLDRLK